MNPYIPPAQTKTEAAAWQAGDGVLYASISRLSRCETNRFSNGIRPFRKSSICCRSKAIGAGKEHVKGGLVLPSHGAAKTGKGGFFLLNDLVGGL